MENAMRRGVPGEVSLLLAAVLLAQWKPRGERNANESV